MKKIFSLLIIFLSSISVAQAVTHTCVIDIDEVHSGGSGGNESYLFVQEGSDKYYLGLYTDERARLRFSMAMTAAATGQPLKLSYYNITCANAKNDKTIVPTGVRYPTS